MKKRLYGVMLTGVLAMSLLMAAGAITPQVAEASGAAEAVGEFIDDTVITTMVRGRLLAEEGLSSLDIGVETNNGVVTLTGATDNPEISRLAERVAKEVGGVRKVENKMIVEDGKNAARRR